MGIWIAAVITTVACTAFYGYLIFKMVAPQDRRWLLIAALCALPLQPLAFYAVRLPLHAWLTSMLAPGPLLTTLTLFYAPLTEEPAKWLVLLLPFVRRRLDAENAIPLALAIGAGFGIGELWFIAQQVARVPEYAAVPFYMFTGFLGERFAVCFLHGAFIAYAVRQLAERCSFLLGGLIGIALHFAANFPIFLISLDPFGLGRTFWVAFNSVWFVVLILSLLAFVGWLSRGRVQRSLFGNATCPECKAVYPRPLLAFNFGVTRYERCPNCRHFHWVRIGSR